MAQDLVAKKNVAHRMMSRTCTVPLCNSIWICTNTPSLKVLLKLSQHSLMSLSRRKRRTKKKNIADAGIKATKDDSNKTSNTALLGAVGEKPGDGPASSYFCVQP
jgi:hypothetical protein